jgi:hypothetical protein
MFNMLNILTITGISIVLVIIMIEIYLNYFYKENFKIDIEIKQPIINKEIIEFNEPNPWNKIIINSLTQKNIYHIKLNNFDGDKFIEWKNILNNIDYNVSTKELSIETKEESEALACVNLIISNMNNDININEILNKNLLKISIKKAKNHKLVSNKLIELIKENNNSLEEINDEMEYNIDTVELIDNIINEPINIDNTPVINKPVINKPDNNDLLNEVNKQIFEEAPLLNNTFLNNDIQPYRGNEFFLI